MVKDLVRSEILIGKTLDEILELLGTPDYESDLTLSYTIDRGHKFGSKPWLYTLHVRCSSDSGTVEVAWYDD